MKNLTKLFWNYELTFLEKQKEAENIYTFKFRSKENIHWQAGQYMDFNLGFGLRRHFTIASSPKEKTINITTKIIKKPSLFKRKLFNLRKDDLIHARNIRGNLIIEDKIKNYVFIAGGIGITPFRAIIWDQVYKKSEINMKLLYANSSNNIAFKKDLNKLKAENKNLDVNYFIEPKQISEKELLNYNEINNIFMIAGPPKMVEHYENILKPKAPTRNIKSDPFWGY